MTVEEAIPTREELRSILADPASTERQIIEAKLVLGGQIANGTDKIRQICKHYRLSSEQTAEMLSSHHKIMGQIEDKAAEEVQRLERALAETPEKMARD